MRFKTAVKLAKGYRYIQRAHGNTIFDLVKYQPEQLDEEDIRSDDWIIPNQDKISYFDQSVRYNMSDADWDKMNATVKGNLEN